MMLIDALIQNLDPEKISLSLMLRGKRDFDIQIESMPNSDMTLSDIGQTKLISI